MKALILENDAVVNDNVTTFVNQHAQMFDTITTLTLLAHRHPALIMEAIGNSDAIIFSSTFHNRMQLEKIITLISTRFKRKRLRFYGVDFLASLNFAMENAIPEGWPEEFHFKDFKSLSAAIHRLVRGGQVYEVSFLPRPTGTAAYILKVSYDAATGRFIGMPLAAPSWIRKLIRF